jgi:hypothetical protein
MPSSNSGSFSGLVARGGFAVGALWSNGKLFNAMIFSLLGNSLNVTVGTGQSITTEGAKTAKGFAEWISMNTTAGKTYVFIAEV